MKTLLTTIFTITTFICYSQSDSLIGWSFVQYDYPGRSYIQYSDSGKVEYIHGDTMEVIQLMLKHLLEKDSIIAQYEQFIAASVGFTNCVPNTYRTGAAWAKY